MPRSSSHSNSSRSSSYSLPKSSVSKSTVSKSSVTAPTFSQPSVIHHNHKVERPGFFSNMWQGFGLGAGQAIAHNMFRSDPVVKHVSVPNQTNIESSLPKEYVQCMKEYDNNKDICKEYLEK